MNRSPRSHFIRLLPLAGVLCLVIYWQSRPRPPLPPNPPGPEELLNSPQAEQRRDAVAALARRGASAIPLLIPALKDKDPAVQRMVSRALAQLGPAAQPELTAALKHEHAVVRFQAACLLTQLNPGDVAVVPALLEGFR